MAVNDQFLRLTDSTTSTTADVPVRDTFISAALTYRDFTIGPGSPYTFSLYDSTGLYKASIPISDLDLQSGDIEFTNINVEPNPQTTGDLYALATLIKKCNLCYNVSFGVDDVINFYSLINPTTTIDIRISYQQGIYV